MTLPEIAALAEAEAKAYAATARAQLQATFGLAYLPSAADLSEHLVAVDGEIIGRLEHDPAESILRNWFAVPTSAPTRLGPFKTARSAARAVSQHHRSS